MEDEKTLVELFDEMRKQFFEAYGRYFTPQEAAILTDEIREEIKRKKQSEEGRREEQNGNTNISV